MELKLETKSQGDRTLRHGDSSSSIAITPMVQEDYWTFRVQVAENGQAVVGFPKFSTIGIGFQQEEDWNTNLPYSVFAADILCHIWHNASEGVDPRDVLNAIKMIQQVTTERLGKKSIPRMDEKWRKVPDDLRELVAEEEAKL